MGSNDEENDEYRACRVCTHTCQSAHGKGRKPVVVPRFYKTLSDSAVHSCRNPYLVSTTLCVPTLCAGLHFSWTLLVDIILPTISLQ